LVADESRSRRENGDHPEKRGEHDKQEADAVDAQMISSADRGDPLGGSSKEKGFSPGFHQRSSGSETENQEAKYVSSDLMRVLHLARNEEQHQAPEAA